jgi:hypothetical protein
MLNEKNIAALLAILFVVLVAGFLVHQSPAFAGSLIGHLIGIAGILIMFMALIYPFRKRVLRKRGRQNPLNTHIHYGLIGPCLVVIHSAHKFGSMVGMLCFVSMLLVVLSGIVGKFLFRRVNRSLKQQKSDVALLRRVFEKRRKKIHVLDASLQTQNGNHAQGDEQQSIEEEKDLERQARHEELVNLAHSIAETEHIIKVFSGTSTLFSRWIRVHYLLTFFLFSMVLVHVLTTVYYGLRWLGA